MTGTHLSFLALDGIRLGRPQEASERSHLAICATCAGYLQAEAPPLPAPAWLAGASLPARPHDPMGAQASVQASAVRGRRSWTGSWPGSWLWLLAAAPAAAAALWLLAPRLPVRPESHGTREKGTPTLRLFVKREDRVFVWDGKQAVHPGDRLRLEVRRAGYRFVSVAALPRSDQPPQVLYQGSLDAAGPLLPLSFRVDDIGTEEVLSVILGQAPVPERLHALAGPPDGEAETWRQILMLEKRRSRGTQAASPPESLRGRSGTLPGSQE